MLPWVMVTLGVQVEPQFGFTYEEILSIGRACEELGFTTLTISDHFMLRKDSVSMWCLECWALLAGLAADLSRVRLGPLVTCASYRHPSLLAKMAATVDVMSGGRLEFGIGAGWKRLEYEAYGYAFPPLRERAERLAESIEVLRLMWRGDRPTFGGRYYRLRGAVCNPKPLQAPLQIWVGGKSDIVLDVAARLADGANIPFSSVEAFRGRLQYLRARCERYGREPSGIRASTFLWAFVGSEGRIQQMVKEFAKVLSVPEQRVKAAGKDGFVGPPSQFLERLNAYVEAGAQHIVLGFPRGWEVASMELLHDEVLPALL